MRRLSWVVLAFACLLVLSAGTTASGQEPEEDCKDRSAVAGAVCEKSSLDKFQEFVTSPGRYVAGEAVESFTRWLADGAMWLIGKVIGFLDEETRPDLGASWFTERYRMMIGLAGLIIVPMLMLSAIKAVVRQDLSGLLRSFLLHLPVAALAMFVAVQLTQASLVITDGLSEVVSTSVGDDVVNFYGNVAEALGSAGAAGLPLFALFLGSLLIVIGAFFVWLELLVRSAAVYVAVFFLPLTLAALVWPVTAKWARRLIGTLAAIIVSKFVIVAVISLATAAMAGGTGGGPADSVDANFSTVLGGGVLLLLAALSPFVLMRFIPLIEEAAVSQFEGMSRKPAAAVHSGAGNVYQRIFKDRLAGEKASAAGVGLAAAGAGATGGASVAVMQGIKTVRNGAEAPVKRMEAQTDLPASATANRNPREPVPPPAPVKPDQPSRGET